MSLTRWAFRYRLVTWALLVALMVWGGTAALTLPRREDPDLQGRYVQIIALYPGASALQVESLVSQKLERALQEVDDAKTVRSTSRPGIAVLDVEVADRARNMKAFRDDVRNRVGDARASLPAGVVSVEVNDRFFDTAALILAVTRPGASDRERETLAKSLRDRLRTLPDAGQINLVGEQQKRVTVSLSPARMAQLGITPSQVADAIAKRNVLPSQGGSLALGASRLPIEPTGEVRDLNDLASLVVAAPVREDGLAAPVYLRDVATLARGYADPSPYLLRVNGEPAVGLSVTLRKGRTISALGSEVDALLASFRSTLPPGARVQVLNDLPHSVDGRMNEFRDNLLTGLVLIFVVLSLFMGLRSGLIVGVMLPITILGTFALMQACGRDIQQISIAALIIALGLVVDNSLVVVDNIETKLRAGLGATEAAIEGTDELRVPLLASNLTTVASFAPILLLSGGPGEFVADIGVVTSMATVVSLLLNYTLTPLICERFLRADTQKPNALRRVVLRGVEALRDRLSGLAESGLRAPRRTAGLALAGLLFAIFMVPRLGVQFFPNAVRDQFTIDVWLPEGRDVLDTQRAAARVEAILQKHRSGSSPDVDSFATYIGRGGPRFYYNIAPEAPAPNYAQLVVNTRGAASIELVRTLQREVSAREVEARIVVRRLEQGPPVGAPIAVRVSGDDEGALRRAGEQIKALMIRAPGAIGVYQDWGERPLALKVRLNNDQATLAGLSSRDVAQATQMGFSGMTASLLREGDDEIPIQLRFDAAERRDTRSLEDMYLPTTNGTTVPLRQIAGLQLAPEDGRILRRDGVRTLTVLGYPDGSRLPSNILGALRPQIEKLQRLATWPQGVKVAYGGEDAEVGKSFLELCSVLGLTLLANFVIIALEFNAGRAASTIMIAALLSFMGAVLGLFLMRQPFGFMAFLGIISLSGIATNHAIVLFEYARQEQSHGMTLDRALVDAGRRRLRPILLTVVLSICGLLPQAVNGGSLWPPLAWAQIYGLAMSLLLTVVVAPSVFKALSPRDDGGQPEAENGKGDIVNVSQAAIS